MASLSPSTAHLQRLWSLLPALGRLHTPTPVDQLSHACQCAGRAWAATGSAEWVLAALFHDIGKLVDPQHHALASAAMLAPLLGPQAQWVVRHHDEFMAPYSPRSADVDRFSRIRHRANPWYGRACQFADEWDCRSFAPAFVADAQAWQPLLLTYADALDRAQPA